MKLSAVNCRHFPPYATIDAESGRCRLSGKSLKAVFPSGVLSGSVVKVKVQGVLPTGSFTVLCTIWPDTQNCLQEGQLCMDVYSILLTKLTHAVPHESLSQWTEAAAEVLEVMEMKPLSSICYKAEEKLDISCFVGLAACKDSRLHPLLAAQGLGLVTISRVNPPVCGVVTSSTIAILDDAPSSSAPPTDSLPCSCTAVVQKIIDRTIVPLLQDIPCAARLNGMMLLGPPGVGKTFALRAVQAIAAAQSMCEVIVVEISIPDLLAESRPLVLLDELLERVSKNRGAGTGSRGKSMTYVLVDEIDALGRGSKQNASQAAIKQTLCGWLDHACNANTMKHAQCLVATSNRSEDIDICFRRGGRLEVEVNVLSSAADRAALLRSFLSVLLTPLLLNTEELVDCLANQLAERSGGYVAADLSAVVREVSALLAQPANRAALLAADDKGKCLRSYFAKAMRTIQPSCLRGISMQLHSLSFEDVIGYQLAKDTLTRVFAFFQPEMKARLALFNMSNALGGVLLYGPPGNSKTRLVAAAAASFHLPMISLSSADIYSAYVGDAEAEVRKAFTIARQAAPCILFFDEMDSIVTHRSDVQSSSAHSTEARVLATFLNEMDGINGQAGSQGVIVIGATNRIDCIDPALIRKGRFYQTIHIPPPNEAEREQLVKYFMTRQGLPEEVFPVLKARLWEGMSGAEVENICKEEALNRVSQDAE